MATPNILVLMADQLNPRTLGAYGDAVAQSPTIDRLAREGVVFDSAYCNSPLCAPSRYSWLTGQLPSRIGAYDNASELPAATPTFAHYLRDAGYRTILAGKMHFCGPGQLHGFEERLTTDIYPADFGWVPDWQNPGQRLDWYHNMLSVTQAGPCVRTNQLDFDDEVVFAVRQKLFDRVRENDQRPFFLVASLTHPHDPFAISQSYWDAFEGVSIPAPRVQAKDITDDPHSARIRAMCNADSDSDSYLAGDQNAVSAEDTVRARRAYYGAVRYVDDQFASILQTLEATGQRDNTIVVVLSDHGEMLGERGLWYKMHFFEDAVRVPLIIHAPQQFAARRVAESVSLVDFLPTLLDLAGIPRGALDASGPIEGRSLWPHLTGQPGHDQVVGEYLAEGALAPIVMLRRGSTKWIHSPADPDMLFNLQADPEERYNRAQNRHDAATATLLQSLQQEAATRWNFAQLTRDIIQSQNQRRLVFRAESRGKTHAWDYQPLQDASQRYMRNHLKLDDLEARARFPRPI